MYIKNMYIYIYQYQYIVYAAYDWDSHVHPLPFLDCIAIARNSTDKNVNFSRRPANTMVARMAKQWGIQ